jgi:hypothetical protein
MAEHTTIQAAQSKTTTNYAVYDSPDGDEQQRLVGTYILEGVAEQLGEYIELEVAEGDGEGLSLTQDKSTSSFEVFSSEADAIEAAYISHEVLEEIGADADSTLDAVARPSDEETFNEALDEQTTSEEEQEEEADALLAEGTSDAGSEADSPSASENEAEADDSPQEVEADDLVDDEEIGIAE